ncbi:MAG: dihydroneopterin aldolase [Polyangiaceae bacterium]
MKRALAGARAAALASPPPLAAPPPRAPVVGTTMISNYKIRLQNIRFRARHGALRAERDLPRDFVVDVTVELPTGALPRTDSLSRVFDYEKIASIVVSEGTQKTYKLLETLAQRLAERILAETPAETVTIEVKKFAPPTSASVDAFAVEISARRG